MEDYRIIFPKYASNKKRAYIKICSILEESSTIKDSKIYIDFSRSNWISANLMALLGLVFEKMIINGNNVILGGVSQRLKTIFFKYGFINSKSVGSNISIGANYYKTLSGDNKKLFKEYIWSYLDRLPIEKEYRSQLDRILVEVFINIRIHARIDSLNNPFGDTEVFCTGHFHPYTKTLTFTIANQGCSFRDAVSRDQKLLIPDDQVIKKSLENGFSTKGDRVLGGMGLYRLSNFISDTEGRIIILSGNAYYEKECNPIKSKEIACQLGMYFPGTSITIMFNIDKLTNIDITSIKPNTEFCMDTFV